jgi:hypothetical protein
VERKEHMAGYTIMNCHSISKTDITTPMKMDRESWFGAEGVYEHSAISNYAPII